MKPTLVPREAYPPRLAREAGAPAELWVAGSADFSPRAVAVVGTREPHAIALELAGKLATALARAGFAVVSGGAIGIDAAVHRAALDAQGTTWCVAPTGPAHIYPSTHAALFDEIGVKGTMLWPFHEHQTPNLWTFDVRNRILVTLAEAVIVVQAPQISGALNAAKHARRLGRKLFVCPGPPWLPGFEGCATELARGVARPVESVEGVLEALQPSTRSPEAQAVFLALQSTALHTDEIAARSGLPAHLAATALLTLSLEDVVVEGPAGFFRRANPA